jgi:hypothetical protein
MLKNAPTSGHSSQVRGWLVLGAIQHELAQVGPDFCILRKPLPESCPLVGETNASLIIEIDGDRRSFDVVATRDQTGHPKFLRFAKTIRA